MQKKINFFCKGLPNPVKQDPMPCLYPKDGFANADIPYEIIYETKLHKKLQTLKEEQILTKLN